MPDDDIRVRFGADLGNLPSAASSASNAIQTVGRAGEEAGAGGLAGLSGAFEELAGAIREPLELLATFSSRLRETAELAGAVFAVEKIREFIDSMAELGERTLNSAALTGQSVEKFAQLSAAMQIAGIEGESTDRVIGQLARRIQEALANPTGQAAVAFRNIGVSMAQLRANGNDLQAMLALLIGRWQQYNGLLRTGAFEQALGRGMRELIPLLRQGSEGYEELMRTAQRYADSLQRNAGVMDHVAEKQHTLNVDLKALGADTFGLLSSSVDGATSKLDSFVRELDDGVRAANGLKVALDPISTIAAILIKTIGDLVTIFGLFFRTLATGSDILNFFAAQLAQVFGSIGAAIGALITGHLADIPGAFQRAFQQAQRVVNEAANNIKSDLAGINADLAYLAGIASGAAAPTPAPGGGGSGRPGTAKAGGGKSGAASQMEQWREELQQQLIAEQNFYKDSTAEELAFWQQKLALTKNGSKEQFEVEQQIYELKKRLAQQALRDAEQSISQQQAVDRAYLATFNRNMQEMVAKHQISKQQMYGFEIQYTAQILAEEKKRLEAMLADDRLSEAEKKAYYERLLALEAEMGGKIVELQTKAADDSNKAWTDALKPIADQFATFATDVITRTKSIAAAFDEMIRKILDDILKANFQNLFESLLGLGGGAGGGGGGAGGGGGVGIFGSVLGAAFKGLIGDALGSAIGNPFKAGGEGLIGGSLAGLNPFGSFGFQSLIGNAGGGSVAAGADAGGLFGGSGILSALASAAPAAAGGWVVPSFASGGILSIVHGGEMVLPKNISEGLQSAIAGGGFGGGHTFNLNISALDARSVMDAGPMIVAAINGAMRNGSMLTVPS